MKDSTLPYKEPPKIVSSTLRLPVELAAAVAQKTTLTGTSMQTVVQEYLERWTKGSAPPTVNSPARTQSAIAPSLVDGVESLNTLMEISPSAARALCEAIITITKEAQLARTPPRRPRGGKITAELDQLDAEIEAVERET